MDSNDNSINLTLSNDQKNHPDYYTDGVLNNDQKDPQKRCFNCLTYSTPFWRRSSDRHRILCNACGLYEKTHKKARPLKLNEDGLLLLLKNSDMYNKCVLCDSVCFNRPRHGKHFCDICSQISPKLDVDNFGIIKVPSIINKRLGRNGSYHTIKIRTYAKKRYY